jgi:hypothetical protein
VVEIGMVLVNDILICIGPGAVGRQYFQV